ncbi:MAG: dihydrofolate reductase [Patescibacteria group bacterium]
MPLSIIAAIGPNNVIGKKGVLPWHLPEDIKRFKQLTMGHPIIMGRKTYESIGKPLPGRVNIVITRQENFAAPGCAVFQSLKEAIAKFKDQDPFVIGGAEIYRLALPLADRLYITEVRIPTEGDVFFPEFDRGQWTETSREPHEHFDFVVMERDT